MKKGFMRCLLIAGLLILFSFPASAAEEFSAKHGSYKGWGFVLETIVFPPTYKWRIYEGEDYSFFPGELIAEQRCHTEGEIIYSSLSAGKVHLCVNKYWYRHAYQYDQIELKVGQEAVIGSVIDPKYKGKGAIIIIRLLEVSENGKATFRISQRASE